MPSSAPRPAQDDGDQPLVPPGRTTAVAPGRPGYPPCWGSYPGECPAPGHSRSPTPSACAAWCRVATQHPVSPMRPRRRPNRRRCRAAPPRSCAPRPAAALSRDLHGMRQGPWPWPACRQTAPGPVAEADPTASPPDRTAPARSPGGQVRIARERGQFECSCRNSNASAGYAP